MVNGLWTMKIQTNTGKMALGTAVFATGKILGGDSNNYYVGAYNLQGKSIAGEVKVTNYSGVISSPFGSSTGTVFRVKGKIEETTFLLSGYMVQQPGVTVTIKGTKRDACRG